MRLNIECFIFVHNFGEILSIYHREIIFRISCAPGRYYQRTHTHAQTKTVKMEIGCRRKCPPPPIVILTQFSTMETATDDVIKSESVSNEILLCDGISTFTAVLVCVNMEHAIGCWWCCVHCIAYRGHSFFFFVLCNRFEGYCLNFRLVPSINLTT